MKMIIIHNTNEENTQKENNKKKWEYISN